MTLPESILLPSQEALLLRLQHISLYGEQLILLIGEQGAGKTTLITALLNELDEHSLALVTCPKHCDIHEIRRKVLIQLLKEPVFDDELTLSESLQQAAETLPNAIGIVIDDADYLPQEMWAECLALSQLSLADTSIRVICTSVSQFLPLLLAQLSASQAELLLPISIEPLAFEERQSLYDALLIRSEQSPFIVQDIVFDKLLAQKGTPLEVVSLLEIALLDEPEMVKKVSTKMKWGGALLCFVMFVGGMVFVLSSGSRSVINSNGLSQTVEDKSTSFVAIEAKKQPKATLVRKRETFLLPQTDDGLKANDDDTIVSSPSLLVIEEGETGLNATEIEVFSVSPSIEFSQLDELSAPLLKVAQMSQVTVDDVKEPVDGVTGNKDVKRVLMEGVISSSSKNALKVVKKQSPDISEHQSSIIWPTLMSTKPTQGYTLQLANVTKLETLYRLLTKVKDVDGVSVAQYKQGWLILVGQFDKKEFANKKSLYLTEKYKLNKPWVRRWTDLNAYELKVSVPSREIQ